MRCTHAYRGAAGSATHRRLASSVGRFSDDQRPSGRLWCTTRYAVRMARPGHLLALVKPPGEATVLRHGVEAPPATTSATVKCHGEVPRYWMWRAVPQQTPGRGSAIIYAGAPTRLRDLRVSIHQCQKMPGAATRCGRPRANGFALLGPPWPAISGGVRKRVYVSA
eukprot:scaffold56794_cov57-Phaeocystis_antarctica.AAC.5